jgi:hypothetical protein
VKSLFDKDSDRKQPGRFFISGKELHGEITLDGPKTSLYLHDKEPFSIKKLLPEESITGILHDLTKVSLLDCIPPGGTGHVSRGDERYFFAKVFPHYIVHGDRHITPTEKIITEVSFIMDDASTLFYDFGAFGHVTDARPFIEQLIRADGIDDQVKPGPNPQILYFTGQHEIFSVDTVIGRIFGSHNLKMNSWGGPDGVSLLNAISVTIAFKEGVWFRDAIHQAYLLLLYLGLLVGRPQNTVSLRIRVKDDSDIPVYLDVFQSMLFHPDQHHGNQEPHPGDVVLNVIRRPEEFSQVTANWIAKADEWNDARMRFFNCFKEQRNYTIERLIASANMFDILPKSAVPAEIELSKDLELARDASRNTFRSLPKSPERDSVLNILGRMGKANLKQKVRYRLKKLTDLLPDAFPDIILVCDEAVNCRNHYVHGGEAPFDYSNEFDAVILFTDTLEFVFAASDLIEAGWDIKSWMEGHIKYHHPFGRYRQGYSLYLQHLKFNLGK